MVFESSERLSLARQPRQGISAFFRVFPRCLDIIIISATGFIIYFAYVDPSPSQISSPYAAAILGGTLIAAMFFQFFEVYGRESVFTEKKVIVRIQYCWAITFALLLVLAFSLKITSFYSRIWAVTWFMMSAGLLPIGRFLFDKWIKELMRDGRFAYRTVIIGVGEQGQKLATHFEQHDDGLTRIIGFVDERTSRISPSSHGCNVLGNVERLVELIQSGMVDQVFIALPWSAVNPIIRQISVTPVRVYVAPDSGYFEFSRGTYRRVADIQMRQVLDYPMSDWSHLLKTVEDKLLAALFILFTGPLMLLIALSVKLDSQGPVFFKQTRYGFNNTLINVWKFRTMYTNMSDVNCEVQTKKEDPRITRVGRFLRRSSLDELPQFFNVLSGDMSVVGPRPHALATNVNGTQFADIIDRYAARHRVKPGITGWAQVNGWRGETDTIEKIQQRVEHDLYYIDNWSVWLDLFIILKTLFVLINDENTY